MSRIAAILLPAAADNIIRGARAPAYVFILISIVSTVRSLIHIVAPDGGAASIAGMDLSVSGPGEIVFAFALWGSAQFIYALIQLLVAFRYRSLVPLMYALLICETLLRMLVGQIKPVRFSHTPPGQIGNYVVLPLAGLMLVWCLWSWQADPPRQAPV